MKIGIKSDFDCLLMIDERKFLLEENLERVEIEVQKNECIVLLVYPTKEKNLLSYAVNVECDYNRVHTKSKNVEILQVEDDSFELSLKKNKIKLFGNGKVHNIEKDGVLFNLVEGEPNMLFLSGECGKGVFEFEQVIKKVAFDVKNSVPYLVANVQGGKYFCAFCPVEQTFFDYEAESVEIDDNQIEIIQNLNDHAKHGMLIKLEFSQSGGIEVKSNELLYLKDNPHQVTNAKVIPFVFFESVKTGDFNLAKSYLSQELANTVSKQMLEEYFGNFDRVIPYNFHKQHGLFMCVVSGENIKVFSFKVEGGKIKEIDFVKEYKKN